MALVINDRVKETSTTTGTVTFELAGAVQDFETFVAGIGSTNTTYYCIVNSGTGEFEVGIGTYTLSGTTLARTTILESSSAKITALVNGAVSASTAVTVDNVSGGTLTVGQRVKGTGISGVVTIATVNSQTSIALSSAVTLADNVSLTIGDEKINWSSGTRTIFCTLPAEKMIFNDASGNAVNFTEQDPNALAFAIALG